jgi:hypothetical protein
MSSSGRFPISDEERYIVSDVTRTRRSEGHILMMEPYILARYHRVMHHGKCHNNNNKAGPPSSFLLLLHNNTTSHRSSPIKRQPRDTHINNLIIINSYYSCSNLRYCSLVLSAPHSSRAVQIVKNEAVWLLRSSRHYCCFLLSVADDDDDVTTT